MRVTRARRLGSLGPVPALAALLTILVASILPRVDSPWPDRIGIEFVFYVTGAGGLAAGLVTTWSSPERREHAIRLGALAGFLGGVALYAVSLFAQLLSGR